MEKVYAPIVLFVYNRPEHTKRTVEGILKNNEAKDSILYIFADGPKPNITEQGLVNLKKTRDYIHKIEGFKDIIIDESDTNRGLAQATIRGCTLVINKHGRMIMIEDDDVPSPYFLKFMNECLEIYEQDLNVWSVCGYVDQNAMKPNSSKQAFFVNRPSSWGFGTWKRSWDKVIWDKQMLNTIFLHSDIIRGFDKWGGRDHYHTMYCFLRGLNSSWSIRYHFAAFLSGSYSVYPCMSLIQNIGCDGSGTHCGNENISTTVSEKPIILPEKIEFDERVNKNYIESFYPMDFKLRLTYFSLYHPKIFNFVRSIYRTLINKKIANRI